MIITISATGLLQAPLLFIAFTTSQRVFFLRFYGATCSLHLMDLLCDRTILMQSGPQWRGAKHHAAEKTKPKSKQLGVLELKNNTDSRHVLTWLV